jgi:hypothetical protein
MFSVMSLIASLEAGTIGCPPRGELTVVGVIDEIPDS